jgi:hypothetical protein
MPYHKFKNCLTLLKRGYQVKKIVIISIAVFFTILIFLIVSWKTVPLFKTKQHQKAVAVIATAKSEPDSPVITTPVSATAAPSPTRNQPPSVKAVGIYCTAWIAGSKRMEELISFLKTTKMNAIVIDIKDDTGMLSYPSTIPLAREIGASSRRIANLKELVARLKKENIYPIARQVVFKDPLLASKHKEIAVKSKDGGLWRDRKGMVWVDPNCEQVWKYNLDIAKEVIALGFSEIQFDYVRFLSDGKISQAVYPYSNGDAKEDVIHNFLLYAKKEINALGAPVSADVFGLVLSFPHDNNIGQKLEKLASAVDILCPMVYPSHYPKNSLNIAAPDLHPYQIITQAMQDGLARIKNTKVKFRPWLQDFNLGSKYGRQQIQAQIKALKDNGITEYLMWNPGNHYDPSKY